MDDERNGNQREDDGTPRRERRNGIVDGRRARLRDLTVTLGSDGVTSWASLGLPRMQTPAGDRHRVTQERRDRGSGSPEATGPGPESLTGQVGSPEGRSPEPTVLASVFVAGFQYHHGMHPRVLWRMEEGDRLVPVREGGNPYDRWAVAVYTQSGARIGYLPRGCSMPIAMMMDQGWPIRIAIARVDAEAEPWERVRVTVWTEHLTLETGGMMGGAPPVRGCPPR